ELVEEPVVSRSTAMEPAEPTATSADGLFDYYVIPHEDDEGVDLYVAGPRSGCELPALPYRGFDSRGSALAWVEIHAASGDLGSFSLLRASRAMYQWVQRRHGNLSLTQVADLASDGGLLPVCGAA